MNLNENELLKPLLDNPRFTKCNAEVTAFFVLPAKLTAELAAPVNLEIEKIGKRTDACRWCGNYALWLSPDKTKCVVALLDRNQ